MQPPAWARRIEKDLPDATLVAALAFHFYAILKYPNLAWADEIFQTVEQGHRWAFGYGVVPWEFRDGIRSWVLPGLLGLVMKATAFLGEGSKGYLMALRVFLALCSLPPVAVAMAWARREKLPHVWIAGLATAGWFELVYFSSKALTEVFAGYALPVALYWCMRARDDEHKRAVLWAGLAWGLAVSFRIHLAPAAGVAMIWTCRRDLKRWGPMLAGGGAVIVAFGMLDWVTWSYPFQSFFLNFYVNVVKGKAAWFGVSPWWEYFASLAQVWKWAAIPLLVLAFGTFVRWPLLPLTAGVILLVHSAIGHKEYRFLVPFLVIIAMSAGIGLARLFQTRRSAGVLAALALGFGSAEGARHYDWNDLAPRPAGYNDPIPLWSFRAGSVMSFEALSTKDTICGLGAIGMGWGWTGGYSHLHRDVPFWDIRNDAEFEATTRFMNTVVASGANGGKIGPFVRGPCWGEDPQICVYERPGACDPPGDYTMNKWLEATNM